MISRIVDMDKKARSMTDEAQKSKIDYEQQIIRTKEKIKNDYLERAKKRLEINEQNIRKNADEKLNALEVQNKTIIEKLDKNYSENGDKWVDRIVDRVVNQSL
ncbi:MAG: hypothetical protein II711_01470 [Clostridia bacterium]|nr:hypothetical protein [Clostridia bacterium]